MYNKFVGSNYQPPKKAKMDCYYVNNTKARFLLTFTIALANTQHIIYDNVVLNISYTQLTTIEQR